MIIVNIETVFGSIFCQPQSLKRVVWDLSLATNRQAPHNSMPHTPCGCSGRQPPPPPDGRSLADDLTQLTGDTDYYTLSRMSDAETAKSEQAFSSTLNQKGKHCVSPPLPSYYQSSISPSLHISFPLWSPNTVSG